MPPAEKVREEIAEFIGIEEPRGEHRAENLGVAVGAVMVFLNLPVQ
jgi:hypothetical protein